MKKIYFLSLILLLFSFRGFAQWYPISLDSIYTLYVPQFINQDIGWLLAFDENPPNATTIFNTTDGGSNWQSQFTSTAPIISEYFLDENHGWFCKYESAGASLYYTSDGGNNWVIRHSGFEFFNDLKFFDINNGVAVGMSGAPQSGATFRTTNGGIDWQTSYSDLYPYCCYFLDSLMGWYSGSTFIPDSNIILKTIDGGNIWTELPSQNFGSIWEMKFFSESIGLIITSGNLYKTTDSGLSWNLIANSAEDFSFVDPNNGWYVSSSTIYKTTNGGINWYAQYTSQGTTIKDVFFLNHYNGWASCNNGLLLKTINGGIPVELNSFTSSVYENDVTLKWQTATETNNQGFQIERRKTQNERSEEWQSIGFINGNGTTTEPQLYSFVDEKLHAGKYQYRLKQIDYDGTFEYSNTIEVEINQPTEFSLEQNYPNPFNPVTKINYNIPLVGTRHALSVLLKVYDVLGKEVATLVNEEKPAGSYEVDFDARNMASGIYYYQLRVGGFVETKKMILMK